MAWTFKVVHQVSRGLSHNLNTHVLWCNFLFSKDKSHVDRVISLMNALGLPTQMPTPRTLQQLPPLHFDAQPSSTLQPPPRLPLNLDDVMAKMMLDKKTTGKGVIKCVLLRTIGRTAREPVARPVPTHVLTSAIRLSSDRSSTPVRQSARL